MPYLRNQLQYVSNTEDISSTKNNTFGIPKPLNDAITHIKLFANDISENYWHRDIKQLYTNLSAVVERTKSWIFANRPSSMYKSKTNSK